MTLRNKVFSGLRFNNIYRVRFFLRCVRLGVRFSQGLDLGSSSALNMMLRFLHNGKGTTYSIITRASQLPYERICRPFKKASYFFCAKHCLSIDGSCEFTWHLCYLTHQCLLLVFRRSIYTKIKHFLTTIFNIRKFKICSKWICNPLPLAFNKCLSNFCFPSKLTAQKWSFPLRISSGSCGFIPFYWRNS